MSSPHKPLHFFCHCALHAQLWKDEKEPCVDRYIWRPLWTRAMLESSHDPWHHPWLMSHRTWAWPDFLHVAHVWAGWMGSGPAGFSLTFDRSRDLHPLPLADLQIPPLLARPNFLHGAHVGAGWIGSRPARVLRHHPGRSRPRRAA
jgi:hypothetical protein